MMHDRIAKMLSEVVDELNQLLPPEAHLVKNPEAPLAGNSGRLDSAGLINLIVATEQKAAEELGIPITLTDEDTLSRVNEVFGTLGALAGHIAGLLQAKSNAPITK